MEGFRVGSLVIVTDGINRFVRKIDGVKRGNIRVGSCIFDWCGNEIDCHNPTYKIYPFEEVKDGIISND